MGFTFREKMLAIVGTTAAAFLILISAEFFLTHRMEQQLTKIQNHYIPVMELGPRLESDFEHLRRAFQDSVAAQDKDALEKTADLKARFLEEIRTAGDVIDAEHAGALQEGVETYFASALDVSARLMKGETGVTLVSSMGEMQKRQGQVETLLKQALTLDRDSLTQAFTSISDNQRASGRALVLASLLSLFLVTLLSLGLSRAVLRSLSGLSSGFTRFGKGDFSQPIFVTSTDELGAVAQEANQMADRIKNLLRELDSFSSSVAHDLRAPLRSMIGYGTILMEDHGAILPRDAIDALNRIMASGRKMGELIDSLLKLSRLARVEIKKEQVNLSTLAREILAELQGTHPERKVALAIENGIIVSGDRPLLQVVLTNLLSNAWKFTSKKHDARIEFGVNYKDGDPVYFVKDNGAGFDMQYAGKLFGTFQRLHSNDEFEGTGVGLATVQSIIRRHVGDIWAESKVDEGAVFYFTVWKNRGGPMPAKP